jgi:predicted aconitase
VFHILLGGKVTVPTSLNSISVDRRQWELLNISPKLGIPAYAVSEAYLKLGGNSNTFTCAPYSLQQSIHPQPKYGEHIAWGESNAVVFANSVIGAKTIKYPDYLDICAALVGRVPAYGVHLDENRYPMILLDVSTLLREHLPFLLSSETLNPYETEADAFYPLLGYVCGTLSDSRVPLVVGLEASRITTDQLKSFSAAFGTTGSSALFHIAGITPEAKMNDNWASKVSFLPTIKIALDDIQNAFCSLDSDGVGLDRKASSNSTIIDLVAFGNPHLSLTECLDLAKMVELQQTPASTGSRQQEKASIRKKHPNVKVVATLSRSVFEEATKNGYIETMSRFGFEFINDTCWCMLTEPVVPVDPHATIMTNSGKYAHYAPALVNKRVRFGSMAACLKAAQLGTISSSAPRWLLNNVNTSKGAGQRRGLISCALNEPVVFGTRRCQHVLRRVVKLMLR